MNDVIVVLASIVELGCIAGLWLIARSLLRQLAAQRTKNAELRAIINDQTEAYYQLWRRSMNRPTFTELYGDISYEAPNSQGRN